MPFPARLLTKLPLLSPLTVQNIVGSYDRMVYPNGQNAIGTGEFLTTQDAIADIIRESLSVKQAILNDTGLIETIAKLGEEMSRALHAGRKILFFGNGGSAADAQHMAAELVGRFIRERRPLPALALTTNSSSLTAIGNDYSYEKVFARQVEAFGAAGDVAIGISTSGKSPNVIDAIRAAKRNGLVTAGMTGHCGRQLAEEADYCLRVPSETTPRIQEAHTLIGHILCQIIDESF